MPRNEKAQTSIVHHQVNEYHNYRFFSTQDSPKNENNMLDIKLEKWNQFFNPDFKVESS